MARRSLKIKQLSVAIRCCSSVLSLFNRAGDQQTYPAQKRWRQLSFLARLPRGAGDRHGVKNRSARDSLAQAQRARRPIYQPPYEPVHPDRRRARHFRLVPHQASSRALSCSAWRKPIAIRKWKPFRRVARGCIKAAQWRCSRQVKRLAIMWEIRAVH